MTAVAWFRNDLRLDDNPAWAAATASGEVVPLFVVDPALWRSGSPRTALLAAHLRAVDEALAELGGRLLVRTGRPAEVLPTVVADTGAATVHASADVSPYAVRRDTGVGDAVDLHLHEGRFVHAPGAILTEAGDPYRVFTPFHRKWGTTQWSEWAEAVDTRISSDPGEAIPAEGEPAMAGGAGAARDRLAAFLDGAVDSYGKARDRPDLDITSRLSSDLKFGTLSPRLAAAEAGEATEGRRAWVRQLAWRDFYGQVMAAWPQTASEPMNDRFARFPWEEDPEGLEAWKEGRTGYPLVDAGMRQLMAEGFMHNRVRMVAGSFLVKHLLLHWREGERHFRRLLLDADPAQNVGNWQWVAGSGADAAPYFRIFNPVSQGERHDPHGDYVRRWVPELAGLDERHIHAPWEAPPPVLQAAGVTLGEDYPHPIVDHAEARERALAAYDTVKGQGP
jgi:deoxyribodipyrimidine photo-lyase